MSTSTGDITVLLAEARTGSKLAKEKLALVVHHELRRIAARHLGRERQGHTLQPTALVNDAYLGLLAQDKDWQNRAHFFAVASSLMRRILVDYARERGAAKRGGGAMKVSLELCEIRQQPYDTGRIEELLALDEALSRLQQLDDRQFRVVEMRFFGGMTEEEIAAVLGISARTVKREWTVARAWLHGELSK